MTADLIERLAREAGLIKEWMVLRPEDWQGLQKFAALVAEECAKDCDHKASMQTHRDNMADGCKIFEAYSYQFGAEDCAHAIRAKFGGK